MKKLLSLFAALLVLTGLKAQTTEVKKETTAPKPANTAIPKEAAKQGKLTNTKNYKDPAYKYDNSVPAKASQLKKNNTAPLKVTDKAYKGGK